VRKRFLIILRHAPYGQLAAAEVVRHLNGAVANGLDAAALLLDDGVYLARAGQQAMEGWTELSAALAQSLAAAEASADGSQPAVYVHAAALSDRGLRACELIAETASKPANSRSEFNPQNRDLQFFHKL